MPCCSIAQLLSKVASFGASAKWVPVNSAVDAPAKL